MSLFKKINTENKLRLTLTFFAMNTLQEDCRDFDMTMAALVNRIITFYGPQAAASVSARLAEYKSSLSETLAGVPGEITDRLCKARELQLRAAVPSYKDTPESFLFRVNNANMFLLTEDPASGEELYYPRGMKVYVQALVEEFCRLPFLTRERVYYKDILESLQDAMKRECAVYILHSFGQKYLARIYDITSDPLSTYTYVVCRLISPQNKKRDGRIYSFRLSRIKNVIPRPSISGAFSPEERKKTAAAVAANGVQFVSDRVNTIIVEFTDEGLKLLKSNMQLRPHVTKVHEDGHTLEFRCTSGQAIFYFRRLGAQARVIKPAFIRRELASWYLEAAQAYSDSLR